MAITHCHHWCCNDRKSGAPAAAFPDQIAAAKIKPAAQGVTL
jgi:hypothetical protein